MLNFFSSVSHNHPTNFSNASLWLLLSWTFFTFLSIYSYLHMNAKCGVSLHFNWFRLYECLCECACLRLCVCASVRVCQSQKKNKNQKRKLFFGSAIHQFLLWPSCYFGIIIKTHIKILCDGEHRPPHRRHTTEHTEQSKRKFMYFITITFHILFRREEILNNKSIFGQNKKKIWISLLSLYHSHGIADESYLWQRRIRTKLLGIFGVD